MGLRIKTNEDSLIAQRQFAINVPDLQDSIEKLSSGYRINKSSDRATGFTIPETIRAKMRGFSQAKRNAFDGISFLQAGEGSLRALNDLLACILKESMSKIIGMQPTFGSLQNCLYSAITSIDIATENLNAAQSRIRDVDYAMETSRFPQNRTLVSAGTPVLSQANQISEHVLSLLRQ